MAIHVLLKQARWPLFFIAFLKWPRHSYQLGQVLESFKYSFYFDGITLTFIAEIELFKRPMYPLNYKKVWNKHTFVEGQYVQKSAQTTNLYRNSTSMRALNNQDQMQSKRLTEIGLEE